MYLDQLDQLLSRLTEAEGAMSANLVELESHPTTKLIRSAGLTGTTAAKALPAVKTIEDLWGQYSALHQVLQDARELRGNGRRLDATETTRFEQLLCGPSITVTGRQVPLEQRSLVGQTEATWQVSPGQLIQSMTTAFDQARDVVFTVDRLWRDLVPQLEQLRAQLTELSRQAEPLGVVDQVGVPKLRAAVDRLGADVVSDPMAVGDEFRSSIEPALATCRRELAELVARHASLQPDLDRARSLIQEIGRLRDEGASALPEARKKIANPEGLLEPIDADVLSSTKVGLVPWLDRLTAIVAEGNWQVGRRGLDQWLEHAQRVRQAALAVRDANQRPLRRRDELRGRLAAYRAKAASLGFGEQADLEALYDAAHDALHTAPADLLEAADLVARYSASLQGVPRRPADRGEPR